jgi:hypothetical protein
VAGSDHAWSAVVRDCDRSHGAALVTAVVWAQEEAMFPVVSLIMVSPCHRAGTLAEVFGFERIGANAPSEIWETFVWPNKQETHS